MAKRKTNSNKINYISWATSEYHGEAIDSLTPIHKAQQIHKYRLGLLITGIVAMVAAVITIILVGIHMHNLSNMSPTDKDPIQPGITATSMAFLATLLIDIIFTVNLNRYINDKKPLILYIPCCALMLAFSIPQLIVVIAVFGVNVPESISTIFKELSWANYVTISVCFIYVVAELIRIIIHRQYFDLKSDIRKALR